MCSRDDNDNQQCKCVQVPIDGSVADAAVKDTMVPDSETCTKAREKQFVARPSPLTEIFSTKHGGCAYRMAMVLSVIAVLSTAVASLANHQQLCVGQDILWYNVRGIPLTMVCWFATYSLQLILYSLFSLWAHKRQACSGDGGSPLKWDVALSLPALVTAVLFIGVPPTALIQLNLPPVCRFGLLMEQIRFLLKMYSFLCAKVPEVLSGTCRVPQYKDVLLYTMVPTMIYSDTYPRSDKIRWSVCCQHCWELLWAGIVGAYLIDKVHTPALTGFRSVWLDTPAVLASLISNLVPTTLILLIGFFSYFHSFSNLIAELTGFQDRLFYKDWWNAGSFKTFFTSWNTLIQDWLYQHVFVVVRRRTGSHLVAAAAVFAVSGLLHEYVLCFFFGFFFPVMAIVFVGAGSILKAIPTARVSRGFGNWVLWLCIPFGSGIIFTAFVSEIYARHNCPFPAGTECWSDYFIPRSWSCPLTE